MVVMATMINQPLLDLLATINAASAVALDAADAINKQILKGLEG